MHNVHQRLDALATRAGAWVDALPAWLRPAFYGACLLPFIVIVRAVRLWPLLVVLVLGALYKGELTTARIGTAAEFLGLATCGAAIGGLAYGVVGRPLRRIRLAGRYLAGLVAITPYIFSLTGLQRISRHQPLATPFDDAEWFSTVISIAVFGLVIGHTWFQDTAPGDATTRPHAS